MIARNDWKVHAQFCIIVIWLFSLSLVAPAVAKATSDEIEPQWISSCTSEREYTCYPHQTYAPVVTSNTVQWRDMPLGGAETQRRFYVPFAPYMHKSVKQYGYIFGTALCQADNAPAYRATIYFDFVDGTGYWTSGTSDGDGHFGIQWIVGTSGRLSHYGHILSDVMTITPAWQTVTVYLDCSVSGDRVTQ